jgi:nucleotide-binding universal stress UspA family protein
MDRRRTDKPVLVGVDGSPSSLQAVQWAAREALRRRAPLQLVHAAEAFTVPHQYGDLGLDPRLHELMDRRGLALVAEAAEAAATAAPGVEVRREVQPGYPIARLAAQSRSAQLLVLGSCGLGGVPGRPGGAVAAALAAHAACLLLERSRHARLLVVGSRGRGSAGPTAESVSHAVLQHEPRCPVAIVGSDEQP